VVKKMPGLYGKIKYGKINETECISFKDFEVIDVPNIKSECGKYRLKVAKNSRNSAGYEERKILVIFEGEFLNKQHSNKEIAKNLYKQYVKYGEHFVKELRGSFQIVVIDEREIEKKVLIYSDHIASRQMFYTIVNDNIIFSPDIEPMIDNMERKTANEMAMVNFLISGHFPAGHTAINEIKVIGPGEYLSIKNGYVKKRKYFNFKITPDEKIDTYEAIKELDTVLKDRIIEYWSTSKDPAILLSGGYDSQFIFYTIADSVEDTSKLVTVTWGQNPNKRFADMDVARRTAKRFKTKHIEIVKNIDNWESEYNEMFIAQNGMTDSSFYHANELSVCKKLYNRWGIRSIIRGDECLGYGPDVNSVQSALKTNSMSLPEYVKGINRWFVKEKNIIEKYHIFMNLLVEKYECQSYNCLKDTLDFYERQNMNRNPLNYYKLHYLDVFCPLIDTDVLKIFCKLPERFRNHKRLFKKILKEKIGDKLQIAEYNNLTNWEKEIIESREIKDFFIQENRYLPEFLNRELFNDKTATIIGSQSKNIKNTIKMIIRQLTKVKQIKTLYQTVDKRRRYVDNNIRIPTHFLIIRAAVLSRWNKLWIQSNIKN
jgi:asparagine synthetase B (glutamine-hydrolysing)